MATITLSTAACLTGLSKRTLWRRVTDGLLHLQGDATQGEHARVPLEEILPLSRLQLEPEDFALLLDADAGQAEAQCDLALEFIMQKMPAEAVQWLKESARQHYPEAVHQLGRCHIAGTGVAPDEAHGIALITQAASLGHSTAKHLAHYLMDPARPRLPPAELEAKLDAIEQKVVLSVLAETADPA
jgi:TPR repeat protein